MVGPIEADVVVSERSRPRERQPVLAQRRDRTSREFERIAVELFAAHGYAEVSYDDIAKAAGVSSRTVYRYFPSKEEFLLASPRRSTGRIHLALAEQPRSPYPASDILELMIALSEVHHDSLDEVVRWAQAVRTDPDVASRVHGEQALLMERLILDFCLGGGGTNLETTSARAIAATIAAVNAAVVQSWVDSGGRDELPDLYRGALQAVRSSIRPEDALD